MRASIKCEEWEDRSALKSLIHLLSKEGRKEGRKEAETCGLEFQ